MQELCFMSNLTSAEWAAWVQAIFSIVAIIAAIWISRRQFQAAQRLQQDAFRDAQVLQSNAFEMERKRRYLALTGFVDKALEEYELALGELRKEDPAAYFEQNSTIDLMTDLSRAMRAVSPLDMPTANGAKAVVTLRDLIATALWNTEAAFDEENELFFKQYTKCADLLDDNLKEIQTARNALAEELQQPR